LKGKNRGENREEKIGGKIKKKKIEGNKKNVPRVSQSQTQWSSRPVQNCCQLDNSIVKGFVSQF